MSIAEATSPLYYQSGHPFKANLEVWCRAWVGMITSGSGVIFFGRSDEGEVTCALGGVFFPSLNTGLLQGTELVWYVIPKFRGHGLGWTLYRLFEEEAKSRKATTLLMSSLDNDSTEMLESFYQSHGFKLLEKVFVKELL